MIICQVCSNQNKLGTVYCRQCGTKLIIDMAAIEQSIAGTKKASVDDAIVRSGRSAMALCTFGLICAMVFAYVVVPPLPPTVLPPPHAISLFPSSPTEQTGQSQQAHLSTPGNVNDTLPGLLWRQQQAPGIIKNFNLDVQKMHAWRAQLIASVDDTGRVAGKNELAATALTTLALQAWPVDQETTDTITRCQKWLTANSDGLVRKDAITIALVCCAFADWRGLPPTVFASVEIALIDGKAAPWQIWLLPILDIKNQTQQYAALRKGADHLIWLSLLKLIDPINTSAVPFDQIVPLTLTTGETRMAWAFCAWSLPADVQQLSATLSAWSQQEPADVEPSLSSRVGANAAPAVALITMSAPWRLSSTWLPRVKP